MSKQELTMAHFERLLDRIDELEERVAELESCDERKSTNSTGPDGWGDRRDQAVLSTFEKGEETSIQGLMGRYRSETDITNKKTLKTRAKDLRDLSGQFVKARYGTLVYTAGDHDE